MGICSWMVLGGFAGWLASIFAGNNARQGLIGNIVVGIIGAIVGGFVFGFFGGVGVTGFNLYSLLVATVGAIITLALKKALFGRA
ncbi:MAG: GlsB/YeaQ/YmgE family stress response membrane protein [Myxococcota bacterium]